MTARCPGISRGSPEQVIDGWRYFGYQPQQGQTDADMARGHAQVLLEVLRGDGFAQPNPARCSRPRRDRPDRLGKRYAADEMNSHLGVSARAGRRGTVAHDQRRRELNPGWLLAG
jgi:hypothetical protein